MSEGLCSQAEFHQHGATIPDRGPVQKYFLSSSKIHSQNSGELGSNCPRHWQPAVFSGKISPTNPAVQVAQNLAYPSSDAYLELTWALPRAAPADTHLEELESRNIIPPLGNYLLVATGGEKGALVPGRVAHQKLNLRNIGKIRPLWNSVPFVQCPSGKQPLSISQEGFLSSHSITRKILPQDWGADFFSPLDLKKTCHMLIIR